VGSSLAVAIPASGDSGCLLVIIGILLSYGIK